MALKSMEKYIDELEAERDEYRSFLRSILNYRDAMNWESVQCEANELYNQYRRGEE